MRTQRHRYEIPRPEYNSRTVCAKTPVATESRTPKIYIERRYDKFTRVEQITTAATEGEFRPLPNPT